MSLGKEKYILCRSDKNTKNRHVLRHHGDLFSNDGCYEFIVSINDTKAQKLITSIGKSFKTSQEISSPNVSSMLLKSDEAKSDEMQFPNDKVYKSQHDQTSEIANDPIEGINKRLDVLTSAVEQLKSFASTRGKTHELGPLLAIGQKNFEEALPVINQWSCIENIGKLLDLFPAIRFYTSNIDSQISVLRCDTCYRYLTKDPFSTQKVKDAIGTAKKGVGRFVTRFLALHTY